MNSAAFDVLIKNFGKLSTSDPINTLMATYQDSINSVQEMISKKFTQQFMPLMIVTLTGTVTIQELSH